MGQVRLEKDSIGEMEMPEAVYYGIQSERARQNFDISGVSMGQYHYFIWAMAAIKKAAAEANKKAGSLDGAIADAICQAADEAMAGKFKDAFPMDIFQGGGGTSANMNMNEVLGNRANEILCGHKGSETVHPNTHVNMGQSTNDVIPAAMKLACYLYLGDLVQSAAGLEKVLAEKEVSFADVVKLGRTCIQDAVPLTLGQEFSGYRGLITRRKKHLQELREKCLEIPLGGTAVGTELSTAEGYLEAVYPALSAIMGVPVAKEENFFDGLQNGDIYEEISCGLKALATGVSKIATDLRMLSSGPRAGFGEIELPAVQPGSSIMPGKINPVMPELINQVCYQVCGNDVAVTMAVEGGELDLNVWEPVIIKCLAESSILLTNGIRLFTEKCVVGIKANREICRDYSERSTALSTVIATLFGYPKGSAVAKMAAKENKTVKEIVIREGILGKEDADILLDPILMAHPRQFREKIKAYQEKQK